MHVILTNRNGLNRIANTLPTLLRNCERTGILYMKISETFLQLSDHDYEKYRKFHSFKQNIASAIKVMKGRKPIDEGEADDD